MEPTDDRYHRWILRRDGVRVDRFLTPTSDPDEALAYLRETFPHLFTRPGRMTVHIPQKRGFASMTEEQKTRIASIGGRAAHLKGTAHEWNAREATEAGRKGGQISRGGRGRLRPDETGESDIVLSLDLNFPQEG